MDVVLITILAGSLGQGLPQQDAQVTVRLPGNIPSICVMQAADRYQVPAALLLSMVRQESGGRNGAVNCANKGGGCDLGIAQINTQWWLPYFKRRYGIEPEAVQHDNCQALMAQSYIVRKEAFHASCAGDLWCAAGRYHSPGSAALAQRYIGRVWRQQLEMLSAGSF